MAAAVNEPMPWWHGALLLAAGVAAYANALQAPLVLDDLRAIVDNGSIHHLRALGSVLTPPADMPTGGRPLLNLTFALNYALSGEQVLSYHLVNVAIHLASACLLYGVVRRAVLLPRWRAGFGAVAGLLALTIAVLWELQPLQTEAVTYISQRAESLMAACYLGMFYCFLRGIGAARTAPWLIAAVACCAAGTATKEVIVTAPLLLLAFDRAFVADSFREIVRRRARFYAALAACWLLLAALLLASHVGVRGVGLRGNFSAWSYALTEGPVMLRYLALCVWPSPLVFDYGANGWATPVALGLGCALLLALAFAGGVVLLVRRGTAIGWLVVAFFVLLAPTSTFVPLSGQPMAESRLYLPVAVVVTAGVVGAYAACGRRIVIVCVLLGAACLALTIQRNRAYRSPLALWTDTVVKFPRNGRAHNNLGDQLERIPGRQADARAEYETALHLQPDLAEAHNNLANSLASAPGHEAEALEHYLAALRLRPNFAEAHNNLASFYLGHGGNLDAALAELNEAARITPESAVVHYNVAGVLARMPGREAGALSEYAEALRLKPDFPEAHNNVGQLLARMPGRMPEAIAHFQTALRERPDYPEPYLNLGNLLAGAPGHEAEAEACFETALRLRPSYAGAHYCLGLLLKRLPGRAADARAHFEAAAQLDPGLTEAQSEARGLQAP